MEVKDQELAEDITIFYVQAETFPLGIQDAFKKLHETVTDMKNRRMYGITECVGEELIYLAGVKENFKNEGEPHGLKTYTIPKGTYSCTVLNNWQQNIPQIPAIFQQLMALPGIKKQCICVEDYVSDTQMLAMVQKA